jgi:hypothetical protein
MIVCAASINAPSQESVASSVEQLFKRIRPTIPVVDTNWQ